MRVSTDLPWPEVAALLEGHSGGTVDGRADGVVTLDVGQMAGQVVRELLRHGGTGTVDGVRRWTLAVFEEAVRVGGDRWAELLAGPALDAIVDGVPRGEVLGWGVVANVVHERLHGQELEVRKGLRHFRGGTRVWVSQIWNGDGGERLWVLGPHRGSRRPVRMVVQRRHLEHPRAKAVYSPAVLRRLESTRQMVHETADAATRWAGQLAARVIEAEVDSPRRWLWVPDPPPMELDVDGATVYLAHFNHRRARYSALPPPVEP